MARSSTGAGTHAGCGRPEHAANVIGFQVGAASLGIALVPGFAGVLAESRSLEIIAPFLVVASVTMLLLHEAIVSRTP